MTSDQQLLDCIKYSLSDHLMHPLLNEKLKTIKKLFYNREFEALFSNVDLCQAYACEYMPSRALCYKYVLSRLIQLKDVEYIYCMGAGNGAELMAIGSMSADNRKIIHIQDMTDYHLLHDLLASIKDHSLQLETSTFDLTQEPEKMIVPVSKASLITACFLFNEIINTSKSGFVKIIQNLLANMQDGAFLLVIDSAGSFSETTIGGNVHMLFKFLDNLKSLEILEQSDATWYRFDKGLRYYRRFSFCRYPLRLNNIRYFIRLYRKVS